MIRSVLPLFLLLCLPALPLQAGTVYTWVDDNGTVQFSDEPPSGGVQYRKIGLSTGRPASRPPSERVQRIRCRDFRGALVQLDELPEAEQRDPEWQAARRLAESRVDQWCH